MNKITTFKNGASRSVVEHARNIQANLGTRSAAGMLRNRGWSVEAALHILLRK